MIENTLHVEKTKTIEKPNISHRSTDLLTCVTRSKLISTRLGSVTSCWSGIIPSLQVKETDDHRDAHLHRPAGLGRDRRGTVRTGAAGAGEALSARRLLAHRGRPVEPGHPCVDRKSVV